MHNERRQTSNKDTISGDITLPLVLSSRHPQTRARIYDQKKRPSSFSAENEAITVQVRGWDRGAVAWSGREREDGEAAVEQFTLFR